MGEHLGVQVQSAVLAFVARPIEGSRLVLQRTRDGFTVQVLGPVRGEERAPYDLESVRSLRLRLTRLSPKGSPPSSKG